MIETVEIVCGPCEVCGFNAVLEIPAKQYFAWKDGGHAQEVFSDWSPEKRELLISGTHPECWNSLFDGMDDE